MRTLKTIQETLGDWAAGSAVASPFQDCENLKVMLAGLTQRELQESWQSILDVLGNTRVKAIRWEATDFLHSLLRTGIEILPEDKVKVIMLTSGDPHEWVWTGMNRIFSDPICRFINQATVLFLKRSLVEREKTFAALGGVEETMHLKKELGSLNTKLSNEIKTKTREASARIRDLWDALSTISNRRERDDYISEIRQLERLVQEKFPQHFPLLRQSIELLRQQLLPLERLRRQIERLPAIIKDLG